MGGADQLAADLAAVPDQLVREVERADQLAAQQLASAASRGAPRRSGRLAGSVDPQPDGSVTVDAPYGRVIHDGWARRNIRAQPFLANAADLVDWPGHYVAAATAALGTLRSNY